MAQFNKDTVAFKYNNETLYEVVMIADNNGSIINPVIGAPLPSSFATLNNFGGNGTVSHFHVSENYIPIFGIRAHPTSSTFFRLINMNFILDAGETGILGFRWHMNPTLDTAYTWSDLNNDVQYVTFDDITGTPNNISSNTVVHSIALVGGQHLGAESQLTPEMKAFPLSPNGIEMFLEVRRLDSAVTREMRYCMTMAIA
jgi:hypothetical protein